MHFVTELTAELTNFVFSKLNEQDVEFKMDIHKKCYTRYFN